MQLWNRIKAALGAFFRALPTWFRTRYRWVLLLVPAIWSITVYLLADANAMGWNDAAICKATMEILHPALLATGAVIAFFGWALTRNVSLAFLGTMCAFALSREFGGQGTSFILYAGLVGLITYGHTRLDAIATFLDSRFASSLMATGYICYAISQLLDRGVVKRLGWLVTWDTSWKPPYATQLEETMEALGGTFLALTVVVTFFLAVRHKSNSGA